MTFKSFQHGNRFDNPKAKQTKKLTQEYVDRYCLERGYQIMSPYVNAQTKIKLQNIETGEIGGMKFNSFQQGRRFDTKRGGINKLTYQEYIKPFIYEGYNVLFDKSKYKTISANTKVLLECPNSHKWSVTRNKFTDRHDRCPICHSEEVGGMSLGERSIYSILSGNNINFKREVSIEINGENHRFDFYLELLNKKYFIEYDGEQHFKEQGWFSSKLEERQRRDRVKDKYAKDNGITMVRIPYTENTVGKVIKIINDKTGLDLYRVKMDLPKRQEVVDYYLNHCQQETTDKFSISSGTIQTYTLEILGMSKRDYLKTLDK